MSHQGVAASCRPSIRAVPSHEEDANGKYKCRRKESRNAHGRYRDVHRRRSEAGKRAGERSCCDGAWAEEGRPRVGALARPVRIVAAARSTLRHHFPRHISSLPADYRVPYTHSIGWERASVCHQDLCNRQTMASTSTNRARCFCGTSCGILPAAVTRHVCKQTDRWCDARFLRTRAGWHTRVVALGYADTP